MSETLDEICSAALRRDPERRAIHFNGQWYRWREVQAVATRVGRCLQAVGAGEQPVVAFVARNRPSALAAFLGMLARRCNVQMLYPFQSSEALAREIALIRPAVVVAAAEDFSEVVKSSLRHHGIAAIALSEMDAEPLSGHDRVASCDAVSGEPQVTLLTSGTTGPPKRFPLGYDTIATCYTGKMRTAAGEKSAASGQDAALLYFPVSNISGLYTTLPPLVNDSPIVLLDRFDVEQWLAFVQQYRPAFFGLPPVGYKMVLDAEVAPEMLASIKAMGAGAAPLDPDIQRQFEHRYGIPILLSYGATEFGGPVTSMTLALRQQYGDEKSLSVGKPLPGMQVRVVDAESGQVLPSDREGVIEVVSCRIGTDWIRTSDLGVIDSEGFLFLKGRADGAIMRGGFKLVPASIEAALMKNPRIALAAVVGIPDPRLGQVPVAALVPKKGDAAITAEEAEVDLRRYLPATHIPVAWKFVTDLPRTPSMKVDIGAVRSLFTE